MKLLFFKIKSFLTSNKKLIIIGVNLSFIFFLTLFPYDEFIDKFLIKTSQSFPQMNLNYESTHLGFFPPKLSLKNFELEFSQLSKPLKGKELIIKPYYTSLFALNPGIHIYLKLNDSDIRISLKASEKDKTEVYSIEVISKKLPISNLSFFSPFFQKSKGTLSLYLNFDLTPQSLSNSEGIFQFKGKDLEFQPYSIPIQYIGNVNFPFFTWKNSKGLLKLTEGKLNIENLILGEESDNFHLDTTGFVNYKWNRTNQSLKNYNFDLKLKIDKEIQSQINFVDLFLDKVKEEIKPNHFLYHANISGKASFTPTIRKIKK